MNAERSFRPSRLSPGNRTHGLAKTPRLEAKRKGRKAKPMVFKGPAGFQRIIYIFMNVVIGIVLSMCLMAFVMHVPVTPIGVIQSAALSFFIGYVVSDLIPAMAWGQMLAAKIGAKGLAAHLISSAVLAFFMGTFILFFCAFINVVTAAGMMGVLGFFISAYPLVLAAAFVCIAAFLPAAMKLAVAISGFNPAAAAPSDQGQGHSA